MTRDRSNDVEILLTFVILFATLQEGHRMEDKAAVFWTTFAAALVFFATKPIVQRFGVPA